ncbi:MAG: metallophosphoesterase [Oscillospiraceae bacterium]|nr:metallophosphoesterase [Oscillospiraceae bacterium]
MIQEKQRSKWSIGKLVKISVLSVVILIILVHVIHALTFDRIIVYNEISVTATNVPIEMDGYRIAFVTDIHAMDRFDGRLQRVVVELNQRQIDLLLIGGDIALDRNDLDPAMELLSQIAATDGMFGIEGNHDHYEALFASMKAHGITPLSNSGVYIQDGFYLAGVEDLWNRNPNVAEAIVGAGPDSFVLLLSHNPDVSMMQDTTGIDLILSGHTHGGQLNFFGRWSIGLDSGIISHYGDRFRGGWAQSHDGTPVYVCRGIGQYYPRVFARPEVTILTLLHG